MRVRHRGGTMEVNPNGLGETIPCWPSKGEDTERKKAADGRVGARVRGGLRGAAGSRTGSEALSFGKRVLFLSLSESERAKGRL